VSADYKFSPNPPALVESMNISYSEFFSLNYLILTPLSSAFVPPSSLKYLISR